MGVSEVADDVASPHCRMLSNNWHRTHAERRANRSSESDVARSDDAHHLDRRKSKLLGTSSVG
jgi:hypothetical protein